MLSKRDFVLFTKRKWNRHNFETEPNPVSPALRSRGSFFLKKGCFITGLLRNINTTEKNISHVLIYIDLLCMTSNLICGS